MTDALTLTLSPLRAPSRASVTLLAQESGNAHPLSIHLFLLGQQTNGLQPTGFGVFVAQLLPRSLPGGVFRGCIFVVQVDDVNVQSGLPSDKAMILPQPTPRNMASMMRCLEYPAAHEI